MPKNKSAGQFKDPLLEAVDSDDNEVVDLLQIVKPGKAVASQENENGDFSADLDAMLDMLSEAEKKAVAAEEHKHFPDPTPVDHEVDYNESLNLPNMDDVDKILITLGEGGAKSGTKNTPGDDAEEEPKASSQNKLAAVRVDELDALPAAGVNGDDLPEQVELDDDFLQSLQERPSQKNERDSPAADMPDFSPGPAELPESVREPKPSVPNSRDEVDLNELDALVDDMLASAPPAGAGAALAGSVSFRQELDQLAQELREAISSSRKSMEKDLVAALGRASSAEAGSDTAKALAVEQGEKLAAQQAALDATAGSLAAQAELIGGLQKEISLQAEKLQALEAPLAEAAQKLEQSKESPRMGERLDALEQSVGEHASKLKALEESLPVHSPPLRDPEKAQADLPALQHRLEGVEQSLAEQITRLKRVEEAAAGPQLAEYIKGVQEVVQNVSVLNDKMDALEQRLNAMQAGMEQAAAAAAAGIIREEIAALLQSGK